MSKNRIFPITLALIAAALPVIESRTVSAAESARDLRTDTIVDLAQPGTDLTTKDFEVELRLPLLWTSSVISADNDTGGSGSPDWHVFPDLSLGWSHQFRSVRLSALGAMSADRYFEETGADINELDAEVIAAWTSGSSGALVPYLRYAHVSYFERDFASLNDRRHDVWMGFTSAGLVTGEGWQPGRTARDPGETSLGIDAYAGRRFANDEAVRHDVAGVTLDYKYVVTRDLTLRLYPGIRLRWYDDVVGLPERNDVRFSAKAKATWAPGWLERAIPGAELEFTVEYLRNLSTDADARYETWELGPTLALSRRF